MRIRLLATEYDFLKVWAKSTQIAIFRPKWPHPSIGRNPAWPFGSKSRVWHVFRPTSDSRSFSKWFGPSETGTKNFHFFLRKKPLGFPCHLKTMVFLYFENFEITLHVWGHNSAKNGQNAKIQNNFEIFRKFPKFSRGFHAHPSTSHGARFAQSLGKTTFSPKMSTFFCPICRVQL